MGKYDPERDKSQGESQRISGLYLSVVCVGTKGKKPSPSVGGKWAGVKERLFGGCLFCLFKPCNLSFLQSCEKSGDLYIFIIKETEPKG